MPQGKLKVKTKLPKAAKGKKKSAKPKSVAKKSRTITPKKQKAQAAAKLQKAISTTINAKAEDQLRARASQSPGKPLAKAAKKATPKKGKKRGGKK